MVKIRAFLREELLLQYTENISLYTTGPGHRLCGLGFNSEGGFWLGYVQ